MNKSLIDYLKRQHPEVTIVMASKYLGANDFTPFIEAGITKFGESRVEAFLEKLDVLNQHNVEKHFLGTLQTKKVKKVINDIDVLHSLDRIKLAKEINKRRNTVLPCFIQVNISNEPQKHGVEPRDLQAFLQSVSHLENVKVIGLMGMAELTKDKNLIQTQFNHLKTLKTTYESSYPDLKYLSMGMSNDYEFALKEGATHLRLGRILLDGGTA